MAKIAFFLRDQWHRPRTMHRSPSGLQIGLWADSLIGISHRKAMNYLIKRQTFLERPPTELARWSRSRLDEPSALPQLCLLQMDAHKTDGSPTSAMRTNAAPHLLQACCEWKWQYLGMLDRSRPLQSSTPMKPAPAGRDGDQSDKQANPITRSAPLTRHPEPLAGQIQPH